MNDEMGEIQQTKPNLIIPSAVFNRDQVKESKGVKEREGLQEGDQPFTETPSKDPKPTESSTDESSHMLYAVELLIFALIGWAWLALRELMGGTPVVDVIALLSALVCSVLNLVFALFFYTAKQFKDPAQAFLNHVACIWLLYIHSLSESTVDGRGTICCIGDGNVQAAFSLRLTYREAFFGGLTLHQPAASITLSFLTILLILASVQARACNENPREWPLKKMPLAVVCVVCSQQAMFGLKAPLCRDTDIAAAVLSMVVLALFFMVDMPWVYAKLFDVKTVTPSGVKVISVIRLLQLTFESVFMILASVLTAVHIVNLGGGDSLLIVLGIALLWQSGLVLLAIVEIRYPTQDQKASENTEVEPVKTTAARFRQTAPPSVLLPGMHELRRARDKKAW